MRCERTRGLGSVKREPRVGPPAVFDEFVWVDSGIRHAFSSIIRAAVAPETPAALFHPYRQQRRAVQFRPLQFPLIARVESAYWPKAVADCARAEPEKSVSREHDPGEGTARRPIDKII